MPTLTYIPDLAEPAGACPLHSTWSPPPRVSCAWNSVVHGYFSPCPLPNLPPAGWEKLHCALSQWLLCVCVCIHACMRVYGRRGRMEKEDGERDVLCWLTLALSGSTACPIPDLFFISFRDLGPFSLVEDANPWAFRRSPNWFSPRLGRTPREQM